MIVGNGQLAQIFENQQLENAVIFASGVADSNCVEQKQFDRERDLLISTLLENPDKKFVYFSSCALSADEYPKNKYYQHKQHMEEVIKNHTKNYYIFRIPQLFGCLKKHKTLINFIYYSIINDKSFNLYSHAYRYVIEINDVLLLVQKYLELSDSGIIIDLANTYRYSVESIVKVLEELTSKKAKYNKIEKLDKYLLDLKNLNKFIKEHDLKLGFGKEYLMNHLNLRCNPPEN